jgi:hypothetical protein
MMREEAAMIVRQMRMRSSGAKSSKKANLGHPYSKLNVRLFSNMLVLLLLERGTQQRR